ncbi:MAG TPA: hypothetical protein VNT54_06080 [Solirubrobacteraceae bacterium]|nr:hypothetical protein [Solirubrobacteraceae bacterium]
MIPFLVGGVLLIVYRNRLAGALKSGDRAFYEDLLGEERTRRLEDTAADSRWARFKEEWVPWFLLAIGVCWVLLSLIVMSGVLA